MQPPRASLGLFYVQGGFAAIDSALSEVDRKDVRGIGISGQQHGFVPMDADGQVAHLVACRLMLMLSDHMLVSQHLNRSRDQYAALQKSAECKGGLGE